LGRTHVEKGSNLKDFVPLAAGTAIFVSGLILLELGNVSCMGGPGIPCPTDTIYRTYSDTGTLLTILGLVVFVIGAFVRSYRRRARAKSAS
jgi:hypothetical protein